jgi:hypothetical protein
MPLMIFTNWPARIGVEKRKETEREERLVLAARGKIHGYEIDREARPEMRPCQGIGAARHSRGAEQPLGPLFS